MSALTGHMLHSFACATVSLPDQSPAAAIRALADAGYGGVEWKVGEAPHGAASTASAFLVGNRCTLDPETTDAASIREQCDDAGITTVGIGPYLQVGDLEGLRRAVDFAVALDAPQLRFQAPRSAAVATGEASGPQLRQRTARFVEDALPIVRDASVRLVLEIHQETVTPSALRAHELLAGFPAEHIGVIYDIGNLVREGFELHAIAIDLLGDRLHHVHLKNVGARRTPPDGPGWEYSWAPLDDGFVDVGAVLGLLAERRYAGWISLEDLSTERAPLATLRHNAAVLERLPMVSWHRATREGA